MANYLYRGDLPDGLDLGPVVAIDSETMGLEPARDRLCLVQLSGGDGDAHLVQILPGQERAPNLERLIADPATLKLFHFGRFDIAVLLNRFGVLAAPGLLHQDRLAAGPHLHRPPRAQGPRPRAARHRHLQAAAVERLGRGRALAGAARLRRLRRPPPPPPARRARRPPRARGAARPRPGLLRLPPRAGAARPRRLGRGRHLRPQLRTVPWTRACRSIPTPSSPPARRVIGIEAAGARRRSRLARAELRARGRDHAGGARAGDRLGHGQVRPRRAQDRGDARLDRHAGALRPSRRGEPRRPRDDHRRRCRPAALQLRRDAGARRPHRLHPALRHPADRRRARAREHAPAPVGRRRSCCRGLRRPARSGLRRRPRRR